MPDEAISRCEFMELYQNVIKEDNSHSWILTIGCFQTHCRKIFKDIDIRSLPGVTEAAVKSALAKPVTWIPVELKCELCKTDSVRSVVCCADCKRKFCRKHADVSLKIAGIMIVTLPIYRLWNHYKHALRVEKNRIAMMLIAVNGQTACSFCIYLRLIVENSLRASYKI
jgi:hypothetical protein